MARHRTSQRRHQPTPLVWAMAAGAIFGVPLHLARAAQGSDAPTAPGTVVNLSGCTGFAVSPSVLLAAKHCGITQDSPLISMTGERSQVVRVVEVPNLDAEAIVSDASDLVPFDVGPVRAGGTVQVYGYGRSRDDDRGAVALRLANLGAAHAPDGPDGQFAIDVDPQGDTVCEGDSGAPALQDGQVTGIVVSGDGPPCGTHTGYAIPAQPALDWLKEQGII